MLPRFKFAPIPQPVILSFPIQNASDDIRQRLSKSRDDFTRSIEARADYENKLKQLASGDNDNSELIEDSDLSSSASEAAKAVASALDIPKSYEEIYSISVRSRGQRSKDKKRVRGSNDNLQLGISGASDCLGDSVDQAETERKHTLVDAYFLDCDAKVNCDLSSTVSLHLSFAILLMLRSCHSPVR